jgi:hypothetical protein
MCGKEAGKGGRYITCRGLRLVILGRIVARLLLKVLHQGFLYICSLRRNIRLQNRVVGLVFR